MVLLLKHKALPEGTTTIKYNSNTGYAYLYKKEGGKWVYVQGQETRGRKTKGRTMEKDFKHSMDVYTVKTILEDKKINSLDDLKEYVRTHSRDESSALFRHVSDSLKKEASKNEALRPSAMVAMKRFGTLMLGILHTEKTKKRRLTVDIKNKQSGKTYRKRPKVSKTESFPASSVQTAEKITGTWNPAESMPTTGEIKKMISAGDAKVMRGTPQKSGTWQMPKRLRDSRYNHILIPFRPTDQGIKVTMQQIKTNKKRTSTVATVQVTVPYAYAQQFLEKYVSTARLKNDLIGQMKRSNGYKNAVNAENIKPVSQKEEKTA